MPILVPALRNRINVENTNLAQCAQGEKCLARDDPFVSSDFALRLFNLALDAPGRLALGRSRLSLPEFLKTGRGRRLFGELAKCIFDRWRRVRGLPQEFLKGALVFFQHFRVGRVFDVVIGARDRARRDDEDEEKSRHECAPHFRRPGGRRR